MEKTTLSDFIAKDNKKLPFKERAKKFEEGLKPLCEEWGVVPWAVLNASAESLTAVPNLRDIWDSGKE